MPAAEVRSVYESNARCLLRRRASHVFQATPKGLINGDDEGLWIRDTAGNSGAGHLRRRAATKTGQIHTGRRRHRVWATMQSGPRLSGGTSQPVSLASMGRVRHPQVEIATDGSLMAGAGKVRLNNADGFTAFNASNAATIYINADGIAAADGGARTTVGSWTSGSRFKVVLGGRDVRRYARILPGRSSSISRTLYPLVMRAIRQGNDAAWWKSPPSTHPTSVRSCGSARVPAEGLLRHAPQHESRSPCVGNRHHPGMYQSAAAQPDDQRQCGW